MTNFEFTRFPASILRLCDTFPGTLRGRNPYQVLGRWERLVEDVDKGYSDSFDEYMNELFVRDYINLLLGDRGFIEDATGVVFMQALERSDALFKSAMSEHAFEQSSKWWWNFLPRRGGGEFAEDVLSGFGVELENPRSGSSLA